MSATHPLPYDGRGQADTQAQVQRAINLCSSPDLSDKLAGIHAADDLSGVLPAHDVSATVKLSANVLKAIPSPDPFLMSLAAKVYARLAQLGGPLMVAPATIQLKQTIEWLQGERFEHRRWGAVLLLRELAKTVPGLLYDYIPDLLDNLWTALRDPKVAIREVAAGALSGCLKIAYDRDGPLRVEWYGMVYEQAVKGLRIGTTDAIHGSLLAYQELFLRAGMFMQSRYIQVCDQILSYRDHRDALVRQVVIGLMSTIAQYNHQEFNAHYLHRCMVFLLGQLKKERDRAIPYNAIGHISLSVGSSMATYLDAVVASIKESLSQRGRKSAPQEAAIFSCISMLARSVGQVLTKHMHELLDLMFAYGLSEPLVEALSNLALNIPPLLLTIQERLLDLLSQILSGEPFRHAGAPNTARPSNGPLSAVTQSVEPQDPATLALALTTLGNFDFSGHILSEFVASCVVNYLSHNATEVRMAAASTTAKLFAADPISRQTSVHAIKIVAEVLDKLLTVSVADPDATIRKATLASLTETTQFDRHLAQAESVRSLFIAMNDEDFEIRQLAIKGIGRLATLNPAYVMPSLRKTLIQLLTELEYSVKDQEKEQAAILLSQLVATSQRITKPYILPMLKVLLPKARDRNPDVSSAIMSALGDLACVGGEDILPKLQDYLDLVMDTLHDPANPTKREAALKTLGQIARSSGYVIEPYLQHPSLLGMLIGILQTDQTPSAKREAVRAMGILGALDPYRYTAVERQASEKPTDSFFDGFDLLDDRLSPSLEDSYYPSVTFKALLAMLRDPSLSSHHAAVVEAIMYIFRSLRLRCVQFLPQIIPAYLTAMRSCPPKLEEYYIQNLGHLVTTVKYHIRNHLPPILALVTEYWNNRPNLQPILVDLIESIAAAMGGEFKMHLPLLLPLVLRAFDADGSDHRRSTTQVRILRAFSSFGANLEDYLPLTLPVIVGAIERNDMPIPVRRAALTCLTVLCQKINFTEHSSRVIHPLIRLLSTPSAPLDLKSNAVEVFCAMMTQIGSDFAIYIPVINKTLAAQKIQHNAYDDLSGRLLRGEELPASYGPSDGGLNDVADPAADAGVNKLPVNQQNLKSAWEIVTTNEARAKSDDWREWMKRMAVQMLKSSPSHSLRACANLAEIYQPLARDLFNAAFVSCWSELFDSYQDELVRAIETALASPSVPTEIMQTLLNLAEFMEHDDKMLPISVHMLGTYANRCHAYAKALHYKETEFFSNCSYGVVEDLIRINNQLQQPDVAMGILKFAQTQFDMKNLSEDWYEKLERWEDALAAYERQQQEHPDNFELTLGRMRCLHALGEWESLSALASDHWQNASLEVKRKIAPLAAASAWGQQDWESMDEFVSVLKHDSADRAWFRAILNVHRGQFVKAQSHINKVRDLLVIELTTLVGESYTRAYNQVVRVQMLSELEEIMQYKETMLGTAASTIENRERRQVITKTWMKRLKGCQRDVEVWQRILKVRALVMSPRESMDMWIKFANLCRKSGRMGLAEKTLNSLLGDDHQDLGAQASQGPPHVIYAHLKFMWAKGEREETLAYLEDFTQRLAHDLGIGPDARQSGNRPQELVQTGQLATFTKLLARCNYKQAEWAMALQDDWGSDIVTDVLKAYEQATILDPSWYKAWHSWALANSEIVAHYMRTRPESDSDPIPHEIFTGYLVPSVKAFLQSIALSSSNALQDTLRLLTLWFDYGYQNDVSAAIHDGFSTVSIETWLEVIPQLIARIHAPSANVRRLVQRILGEVGRAHPQSLVYALTVASKYPSAPRRKAALAILDRMRDHSAILVDQAVLVSQELMRVAVLWHELWYECLEEASRQYFGEHNIEAMFATLEPMHELIERGPETLREIAFEQTYGRDLMNARESGRRFRVYGETADLNQAWELYYGVFTKISKSLPPITPFLQVELEYCSPKLLAVKDLELAVPGTYHPNQEIVRISTFAPIFDVLASKQRPRKCRITGSDGREYPFLLKGHEDIRQDERVMQLFGLCNTLLAKDPETFKRHLMAQRYPAIPLSPNSGLLGWLPFTDTLHVLIKSYRESRKILLNIEQRLMTQMAPDYDSLCLMQKIEVFQYALDNTTGQDLYRVLWLKSRTSEAWLDRRADYSRSLAVMSIIGYILGLGDRHPSNLLLSRENGTVIHVDYGDCFEVAMSREKYPEKVPFRLTRMLQNAMDVSKIEGTFRVTCEHTMRVLRENKESIIAVLEAFSRDPLVNWRLVTGGGKIESAPVTPHQPTTTAQGHGGETDRPGNVIRRPKADESNQFDDEAVEMLNQKALQVVERVTQKLTGKDFKPNVVNTVEEQVQLLIQQATALEHLSTAFIGWCAFCECSIKLHANLA